MKLHVLTLGMMTGSREHGLKYQQLVHGLNIAGSITHTLLFTFALMILCLPFYFRCGKHGLPAAMLTRLALQLTRCILTHPQM